MHINVQLFLFGVSMLIGAIGWIQYIRKRFKSAFFYFAVSNIIIGSMFIIIESYWLGGFSIIAAIIMALLQNSMPEYVDEKEQDNEGEEQ